MPPTRLPYPAELKRQIVELVRAGRSPAELAREFEPTAQTIQNWVRQADRDEGLREDGLFEQTLLTWRPLRCQYVYQDVLYFHPTVPPAY